MIKPYEFDCPDCKTHVIFIIGKPPDFQGRCLTCQFLNDTISDPVERETVRTFLNRNRIIER